MASKKKVGVGQNWWELPPEQQPNAVTLNQLLEMGNLDFAHLPPPSGSTPEGFPTYAWPVPGYASPDDPTPVLDSQQPLLGGPPRPQYTGPTDEQRLALGLQSQWNPFSTQGSDPGGVNSNQALDMWGQPRDPSQNVPIPDEVYHTTPAWQEIQQSGYLQPMENRSGGLGGSPGPGVSLGTNYDEAINVRNAANDLRDVAQLANSGGDVAGWFNNIVARDQQSFGGSFDDAYDRGASITRRIRTLLDNYNLHMANASSQTERNNAAVRLYLNYRDALSSANVIRDPIFVNRQASHYLNLPNEYRTFIIPGQNVTNVPGIILQNGQDIGEIRAPGASIPIEGTTLQALADPLQLMANPYSMQFATMDPQSMREYMNQPENSWVQDWANQAGSLFQNFEGWLQQNQPGIYQWFQDQAQNNPPPDWMRNNVGGGQAQVPRSLRSQAPRSLRSQASLRDNPFVGAGSEASLRNAGWVPPVDPQNVVGTGHKWLEPVSMEGLHKAVDLQAYKGTPAKAPVSGVVSKVQNNPEGLGLQVGVTDGNHEHILAHLDSTNVSPGQQVGAGEQVARVGESGAGATGPHLDYRIRNRMGEYIDPTPLLGGLAQMPRADKPPVGAGQFGMGNPFGGNMGMQSIGGRGMLPQGADFRLMFSNTPTLEGMQKWSGGGNSTDVFTRKDAPLLAPFDGIVTGTGGTFGQGGPVLTDPRTGFSMRITHGQPMSQGPVRKGQPFAIIDDPSMDMLHWPGGQYGNAPGGYQHAQVDFSMSPQGFGQGPMSSQPGLDAESILRQGGFQPTQTVPRTPGPNEGMGGGLSAMMSPGGMGMPGGMMMGGPPGMSPGGGGMGMGMPFGGMMGSPMGMGMGMPPTGMGMGSPFGMQMPSPMMSLGMGMMQQPPMMADMGMPGMGGPSPFMNPGGGNPMNMAPGPMMGGSGNGMMMGPPFGLPQGPFGMQQMDQMNGMFNGGAAGQMPSNPFMGASAGGPMSSGLGGLFNQPFGSPLGLMTGIGEDTRVGSGQFGMGGFGGMGTMGGGMGGMGGGMGMGGMDPFSMMGMGGFGSMGNMGLGGLGMPGYGGGYGGYGGISAQAFGPGGGSSSGTNTPFDQFMQQALTWKPDMAQRQAGPYDAAVQSALTDLTNLTKQPFAPWQQRFQGNPFGSGQDASRSLRSQDTRVGAGQFGFGNNFNPNAGNFNSTLTTDPGQAANLALAQQQLQAQINQFNQNFGLSQQQLQAQLQQMQQNYQQQRAQLYQGWLTHQDDAFFQQQLANLNAQYQNQQMRLQANQFNAQNQQNTLGQQLGLYQFMQGQGLNRELANQQNQQFISGQLNQRDIQNLQNQQFNQTQEMQRRFGNQANQQFNQNFGLNLANLANQQQQAGFGRQMQLYNSALQNPWLQQLSGLAPAWNAPGGPAQAATNAAQGFANMNAPGYGPNLPQAGRDYQQAQDVAQYGGPTAGLGNPAFEPGYVDANGGNYWNSFWGGVVGGQPQWGVNPVDPNSFQVGQIGNWPTFNPNLTNPNAPPGGGPGNGGPSGGQQGLPPGAIPVTNVLPNGQTTTGYVLNGVFTQTGTGTYGGNPPPPQGGPQAPGADPNPWAQNGGTWWGGGNVQSGSNALTSGGGNYWNGGLGPRQYGGQGYQNWQAPGMNTSQWGGDLSTFAGGYDPNMGIQQPLAQHAQTGSYQAPGMGEDVGAGQFSGSNNDPNGLSNWFTQQGQQQAPLAPPNPWDVVNQNIQQSGLTSQGNDPYWAGTTSRNIFPSYQTFSQFDPFQQASIRTAFEMNGVPWAQAAQAMRQQWAGENGQTAPENLSQLSMQNIQGDPLKSMSFANSLNVFGTTPQNYQAGQQGQWNQANQSNVGMFA